MVKKLSNNPFRITLVSGYFDPMHIGHIEYFKLAKKICGGSLIVLLNTDAQAKLKKGYSFMKQDERMRVVESVKWVDKVVMSIDKDQSVCKTIEKIAKANRFKEIIFAKGGDRYAYEIPESKVCKKYNIKIIDGLGKKIQSSSDLCKGSKK